METKVAAMLARVGAGAVSVTAACGELGISRQTYYKYRARFDAEGPAGLVERSRRPRRSPTTTPTAVVVRIVEMRAVLAEEGWDNGATSVYYRLLREGHRPPSRRTIHRVLVREGLVVPQPGKRPRSSYRSFQFPATDDCWQLDAWETRLADGQTVVVFELIDDRSRYLVAARGRPAETTVGAWECFAGAVADYGLPLMVLCDNSLAFTGRLSVQLVLFEKNLASLGVKMINSRPKHPQTCGKNERHHQTAQRWLGVRPLPDGLDGLQALLDEYRGAYNDRPHQALRGATPREQRAASRRLTPVDASTVAPPTTVGMPTATIRGAVRLGRVTIGLGVEFAGQRVIAFTTGDRVQIFWRHHRLADLTLEPGRTYYPTRPRSSRRRRLPS